MHHSCTLLPWIRAACKHLTGDPSNHWWGTAVHQVRNLKRRALLDRVHLWSEAVSPTHQWTKKEPRAKASQWPLQCCQLPHKEKVCHLRHAYLSLLPLWDGPQGASMRLALGSENQRWCRSGCEGFLVKCFASVLKWPGLKPLLAP